MQCIPVKFHTALDLISAKASEQNPSRLQNEHSLKTSQTYAPQHISNLTFFEYKSFTHIFHTKKTSKSNNIKILQLFNHINKQILKFPKTILRLL